MLEHRLNSFINFADLRRKRCAGVAHVLLQDFKQLEIVLFLHFFLMLDTFLYYTLYLAHFHPIFLDTLLPRLLILHLATRRALWPFIFLSFVQDIRIQILVELDNTLNTQQVLMIRVMTRLAGAILILFLRIFNSLKKHTLDFYRWIHGLILHETHLPCFILILVSILLGNNLWQIHILVQILNIDIW